MHHPKTWRTIALLSLVGVELWAFSGSFDKYFNLDSVFYVIHSPRTWTEALRVFASPDVGRQYRPVTLSFMALFVPTFGSNPHPYHYIPIVFHALNSILLFGLARRILKGTLAALAAAAFWGVHSVAGWITYDTTCISDFMLAFFLLLSMILAIDGSLNRSRLQTAGSILFYVLALLTKESAVTIPLALLICLTLVHARSAEPDAGDLRRAFRKALPLTGLFIGIALAHLALLFHWFRAGMLYTQGSGAPYNIAPWTNVLAKTKYLYWALNLPDALQIPDASRIRALIFVLMGLLFACLLMETVRLRGRLGAAAWAGLVWLIGMNAPALMLSDRLAKWYLYIPLLGLSMTVGALVHGMPRRLKGVKAEILAPAALALCVLPMLFSTVAQTRSYLRFSDASYASGVLESFAGQVKAILPGDAKRATFFVLPTFEPDAARILSSPPVDTGRLLELQNPGTRVKLMFAHKGDRLSDDLLRDPDTRVLQNLYGRFYDVTRYYRDKGRMTMFVLPTSEHKAPPLLKKEPIGGSALYRSNVEMLLADEGASLPENYPSRKDVWILQYLSGHFCDVTEYYKSRHRIPALHLFRNLRQMRTTVSRNEYYPSYDRFPTPSGQPVFFPTPQQEILTQIGGSTAVIPAGIIPADARLCFDVSWMYDQGDGAWAELSLRTEGSETVIFRQYMRPNPRGRGLTWKEVNADLSKFAGRRGEVILRCYNERGKNTVGDWLNWRDIAIEAAPAPMLESGP